MIIIDRRLESPINFSKMVSGMEIHSQTVSKTFIRQNRYKQLE